MIQIVLKSLKSHTKIFLFTMTIRKDLRIYSVNPLYLIFGKVNGYFEEINENKYLTLVLTNKSKEKLKIYRELWSKITDLIRSITKNSDYYDEKYMKIKSGLDDDLPLNKMIEIQIIAIVVNAIFSFLKNNNYYLQSFLNECLYKI